jgi:glucosamine-6-phosphate deaminase
MEIIIQPTAEAASVLGARIIAKLIRIKPDAVLGLATGSTPLMLYKELIRMYREDGLDFSKVRTFNLDEYVGLPPDHVMSYHHFMREHLFDHINIAKKNVHLPNGLAKDIPAFCAKYEREIQRAGGIDIQVLGIGTDGHIGFNEPTSSLQSRTRIKTLDDPTREDNARFFKSIDEVPHHCITMGIGTILESRTCLLFAFGKKKARAVAESIEGPMSGICPASALQWHRDAKFLLDADAATKLRKKSYYLRVFDGKPAWQRF